jgi:hypothetical protein
LILDDIDLDCNVRQLRRDLDHGLWIVATAADIPRDFACVKKLEPDSDDTPHRNLP